MRSFVQILTTPTADTPGTTLILHFDNKRYLIGSLAEGTQRACMQMGSRLLKVSECFLTGRTEWKNTGGLIGMILTLADSSAASHASSLEEASRKAQTKAERLGVLDDAEKVRELEDEAKKGATNDTFTIFGPPNLNHTLATARRFVFRKGMPVNVHEIRDNGLPQETPEQQRWKPFWADDNIKVWSMSILPEVQPGTTETRNSATSVSPRKRSFHEMHEGENGPITAVANDLTQEDKDYLTVKAVVGEMFNSSWRLDTLQETPLSEVKLPATIFVRNAQTNKIDTYSGPLPNDAENPPPDPHMKVLVRKPWPGALVDTLPDTKPAKEALSYIIRNHMQRGKFRPEKARELKVKPGPDFSVLSKGESVQSTDGVTVTPDQVMDPSRVGGGIAVVDLPEPDYTANLISRPEWREKQVMEGVGAIIWLCGKDVATDPRLHAFMEEFKHLEHIVSSPDYCPNNIALDSAAGSTVRLNKVDPERYIVPVHDSEFGSEQVFGGNSDFAMARRQHPLPAHTHIAARGQTVQLEPAIKFEEKDVVPALDVAAAAAEVAEDVMEEAVKAQEATKFPDDTVKKWLETLPPGAQDAEVITLGTGSALPSKYRNVSATLVLIPGWGNILLDCGENTLGQLKRVFPANELKQVLRDLKMLCISHMHADHQLGTTSVLKAWYQEVHSAQPARPVSPEVEWADVLTEQRLAVISEPAMQAWLYEYSSVEDFGYSRLAPISLLLEDVLKGVSTRLVWYIPPTEMKGLSKSQYKAKMEGHIILPSLLNAADIQAVSVRHCHGARAISITLPTGFKVSYSGDCRPSGPFMQIGKGSTVCIHEATFDDELQGDAEAKNHSTTSEALDVAQGMGARACVLTHFSQRYQKVPVLERGDGEPEVKDEADLSMSNGSPAAAEDVSMNPEDVMDGPMEDVAATFPDQETSNGSGKQYDILTKKQSVTAAAKNTGPEAVKFKLNSDMKVCVAFDYMRVKVGDIWQLEKFTPALLKLFAEEEKVKEGGESAAGADIGKKGKKEKKEKSKRNN